MGKAVIQMINFLGKMTLTTLISFISIPLQAQTSPGGQNPCNWEKAWVHVYPLVLEVKNYEGSIRVGPPVAKSRNTPCSNRECDDPCNDRGRPCVQLTLKCRVPTETNCLDSLGQDYVKWKLGWDGVSENPYHESRTSGNGKWHPLYLNPEQFTPQNNNILHLRPIAFIGNGKQACANDLITVVLRDSSNVRNKLQWFDFVSATKSATETENKRQLWIFVGQSVVNQ